MARRGVLFAALCAASFAAWGDQSRMQGWGMLMMLAFLPVMIACLACVAIELAFGPGSLATRATRGAALALVNVVACTALLTIAFSARELFGWKLGFSWIAYSITGWILPACWLLWYLGRRRRASP